MTQPPAPARVLTVCTGNICRSPVVERLLRQRLAGTDVVVESAGTHAVVGAPVSRPMVPLLAGAGADAGGFAARQLTPAVLRDVDLVVTLTRGHRSAVVEHAPAAVRRTFTLLELARLLRHVDPAALAAAGATPGERVRALPALAAAVRHLAGVGEDDVVDPIGQSDAVYRASFDAMAPAVDALAAALLAPAR
ncbi:low molecular weight phosphatase family protein [Cellulomonas shaoxiangyii]|uniref:Low molecular weight phosphatase family protein n=1 Tax=Cellulomonas shaoxiangyii TaxID=2566013 RepID=A0A4P7SLX3_9CELL|nr:low molecular weight phosphatase family protein [Cellulomonas shaoxiangyii]QCB94547.1 low molecular weight phosphatase family protein [Cellulomonas shaoxiangyii]TGY82333.1 low molecular weight phosphatase family protein [Cellulomonas shaoxiangyii]